MLKFSQIGLTGHLNTGDVYVTSRRLITFLQSQQLSVTLSTDLAGMLSMQDVDVASELEIAQKCDLVIVIGGDGSMLSAARAMADFQVPLLGVNWGRLGFLTDIVPKEIEAKVAAVLNGHYISETRFLLNTVLMRNDKPVGYGSALNDVVLHAGRHIKMIEFELYIDDKFVYSQRSDGLIVSTPTGSTAYALSGGGPIMHPSLAAIVLVPLNAHTLTSRPIVVNSESLIKLLIGEENTTYPHVTCDGQTHIVTQPGDELHINKKPETLTLIHTKDHDFYDTCRTKLSWASHLTRDHSLL
jgi:NAD+ kinase